MSDYTSEQLRRLDAAVAEARGWIRPDSDAYEAAAEKAPLLRQFTGFWIMPGSKEVSALIPSPTTSIADAMEAAHLLAEEMRWVWGVSLREVDRAYETTFSEYHEPEYPEGYGEWETKAEAIHERAALSITLAYLRAHGIDPEAVVAAAPDSPGTDPDEEPRPPG